MGDEKFEDVLRSFYVEQQARLKAIVGAAIELVGKSELDEKQAPFAQVLLRELDLKLREAGYRLNHICELASQSPRAAKELAGG